MPFYVAAAATLIGAGVSAYGATKSASTSASAAKQAAQLQSDSAQKAQDQQLNIFNQIRGDLMPYNQAGQGAIDQLANYFGLSGGGQQGQGGQGGGLNPQNAFSMLSQYPGYQFQYDQGLQGLNRNLASSGRFTSGAMMKDAQTFGQGQAQSSVNSFLDMLKYIGSTGENAAAQTGNAGVQTGQGVAQSMLAGGTAQASGVTGSANAFNSGVTGTSNAIGSALNSQALQAYLNNGSNSNGYASFNANTGNYNTGPNGFDPSMFQ